MAIRKAGDVQKVAKQQQIPADAQVERPKLDDLKKLVDDAIANDGNFSQSEAKRLTEALKVAPELKAQVAEHLTQKLGTDKHVSISETALSKLSGALDVDFKELFFRRQAQDKQATHEVGAGLAKEAKTVADEHSQDKHKAASDQRLASTQEMLNARKGVEGRPIGGSKGAAYDAATVLGEHLATKAEGALDARLSDEAKAAKDVLREPLVRTSTQVVNEVMRNPETMKSLGDVAGTLGTGAFKESLSAACGNVGRDIVNATGMTTVNVEAVQSFVSGASTGADKLVALAKGTRLESAVATHAPALAKSVGSLGAKLTGGAASTAQAAQVAKTGAQVASGAAATAQVGAAGAKAAGQSVPVVGQVFGVITTGMAAAETIGQLTHKPRDWKRIGLSLGNLVGQAVGIFIPFVGAGTTVAKLAGDAALNMHDKKQGKEPAKVGLQDVMPSVASATSLATPFLEGAGYGDAAAKMRGYHDKLKVVAEKGLSSAEMANLPAAEREAMIQNLMAVQSELEKTAGETKGTPHEAASRLGGEALKLIIGAWRKSKNLDMSEDRAGDAKKLQGEAMEAAAKAAAAQAIIDEAEKKQPKAA